jgi:hypothetical protein
MAGVISLAKMLSQGERGSCRLLWKRHEFEADSDTAAMEVAWTIFNSAGVPRHGVDLWQERRMFSLATARPC